MTAFDKRLAPVQEAGKALYDSIIEARENDSWQSLYGMAQESGNGDVQATEILCAEILNQIANPQTLAHISTTGPYEYRGRLMRQFATASDVAKPLAWLFHLATVSDDLMIELYPQKVVVSPDTHHFAAKIRQGSEAKFQFSLSTKVEMPKPMAFANLLYNPKTDFSDDKNVALNAQRMKLHAQMIALGSGVPFLNVLHAVRIAAMQIVAWRYNSQVVLPKPLTQEQVSGGYFLKVAELANQIIREESFDENVWESGLFSEAMRAFEPSPC